MARINNTDKYNYDVNISGDDFLIGSDAEDNKKTKNYKITDLVNFIEGDIKTPNLKEVTDIGNTTSKEIIIKSDEPLIPKFKTSIGQNYIKIEDRSKLPDIPTMNAGIIPDKLYINNFSIDSSSLTNLNIKSTVSKNIDLINGEKLVYRVTPSGKIVLANKYNSPYVETDSNLYSSKINIFHDSFNTTDKNPTYLSIRTLYNTTTVDNINKDYISTFRITSATNDNAFLSNAEVGDMLFFKSGDGNKIMIGTNSFADTPEYCRYVMLQPNSVRGHYGLSVKSVNAKDTYVGIGVKDPKTALEINSKIAGDTGVMFTQVNANTLSYVGKVKSLAVSETGKAVVIDTPTSQAKPISITKPTRSLDTSFKISDTDNVHVTYNISVTSTIQKDVPFQMTGQVQLKVGTSSDKNIMTDINLLITEKALTPINNETFRTIYTLTGIVPAKYYVHMVTYKKDCEIMIVDSTETII